MAMSGKIKADKKMKMLLDDGDEVTMDESKGSWTMVYDEGF